MHNVIFALCLSVLAGICNGSFALPTKHVTKWRFENIWLNFAIWGFIILPWSSMLFLAPQTFAIYSKIPTHLLLIISGGGIFFGIGQVCFARALNSIGMGLSFAINLGIGIALGCGLPLIVQYPDKIFTKFGGIILTSILLTVLGLIFSTHAGAMCQRMKYKATTSLKTEQKKKHSLGVLLAIISGISSASQNFIFAYTNSIQDLALQLGANSLAAANIMWPCYLLWGFIPYMLYMLYLHYKHNSFAMYSLPGVGKYYFFAAIMGVFSYGSLLLYAKATQLMGKLGPIIGWPIFMVVIILTSNFWGWQSNEWRGCSLKAKNILLLGLGFFVLSVITLGYGSAVLK